MDVGDQGDGFVEVGCYFSREALAVVGEDVDGDLGVEEGFVVEVVLVVY